CAAIMLSVSSTAAPSSDFCRPSLHDALPISRAVARARVAGALAVDLDRVVVVGADGEDCFRRIRGKRDGAAENVLRRLGLHLRRPEAHTSALQPRQNLACRLLLEHKTLALPR